MANLYILVPSIIAVLATIMVVLMSFKAYKSSGIPEIRIIGFYLTLQLFPGLTFIIFEYVKGDQFETLRTFLGSFSVLAALLMMGLLYFHINLLAGKTIGLRQVAMFTTMFFGMGVFFVSIKWQWVNSQWEVIYDPPWALLAMSIPTLWLVLEHVLLNIKIYREALPKHRKNIGIMLIGWIIFILVIPVLLYERSSIGSQSAIYIAFQGIGYLFVVLGLFNDPTAILPKNIRSKSIIISQAESGVPVLEHSFVEDTGDNILFSSAMQGILALMREITQQEDLPKEFGYLNLRIMIESDGDLIGYYVAERESHIVRYFMKEILKEISGDISNGELPADRAGYYEMLISQTFSFAM